MKNIEAIAKENWREAPGVRAEGTNSALALRDYSVECQLKHYFALVQGYYIWWCSAHHQPSSHCELGRLRETKMEDLFNYRWELEKEELTNAG